MEAGVEKMDGYVWMMVILTLLLGGLSWKTKRYSYQKEYRKCESPIETKMMDSLKRKGYQPYTQVPCGKYRIDIVLYRKNKWIGRKKIAIECDGAKWHSSPEQVEHDLKKNRFLQKRNWTVIRLRGKDIYHRPDWCVEVIESRM